MVFPNSVVPHDRVVPGFEKTMHTQSWDLCSPGLIFFPAVLKWNYKYLLNKYRIKSASILRHELANADICGPCQDVQARANMC